MTPKRQLQHMRTFGLQHVNGEKRSTAPEIADGLHLGSDILGLSDWQGSSSVAATRHFFRHNRICSLMRRYRSIWNAKFHLQTRSKSRYAGPALHQRLYARSERFDAFYEIVEGQQHAAGVRHLGHVVQHACYTFVASDQCAHVDVHGTFRRGQLADVGVGVDRVPGTLIGQPRYSIKIDAVIIAPPFSHGFLVCLSGDHHD